MKIIKINAIPIEIHDDRIDTMREFIMKNTEQEILIRNKHDTEKLSKKTSKDFEEIRLQRLQQAINDNDKMYLNSILNNVSLVDLIKEILLRRKKNF